MATRHADRVASRPIALRLRSLWQGQAGAEIVQFAVMLPIVLGIVWITFNAFQIVSLRAKMRTTASQMAQYITAYAVPPMESDAPVPNLCDGLQEILYGSFVDVETNMGDPVLPTVSLYVINNPVDPTFEGNRTPVSCQTLADRLQVNQQFAVELDLSVNWLWLNAPSAITMVTEIVTLNMTERAFGVCPGEPFFILRDVHYQVVQGPGGCTVDLAWTVEGSFTPQRYEFYEDNDNPENRLTPVWAYPEQGTARVIIPPGEASSIVIKAISFAREDEIETPPIGCNMPDPTPEP